MSLQSVRAKGRLDGLLFDLTVRQHYRNDTSADLEVVYTLPLAHDAVLLGLKVEIGDRRLVGVVTGRAQAQREYEEAIEEGNTAVMLERAGDGLYTLNLGNLRPGEQAVIEFRTGQFLRFEQNRVRVHVPTTIADRYGMQATQAGLQPHQQVTTDLSASYPFEISIEVMGALAQAQLSSPSHAVRVDPVTGGRRVSLAAQAWLDRDFVLVLDGIAQASLSTVSQDGDDTVALVGWSPTLSDAQPLPLDLKIVVDCSGSMAGDSIEAARRALHAVLAELTPADRVSFTRFGSTTHHAFGGMKRADAATIRSLSAQVSAMQADLGGTEIEGALSQVFALDSETAGADVLLVTDALSWDIEGTIAAGARAGQRVFSIGIGSAPGESMLRGLASRTGGGCELVSAGEDGEAAILRTFRRLRQPRVHDVSLRWPAGTKWELPVQGAIFAGDTAYLAAAFAQPPAGELTVRYRAGDDSAVREAQVELGWAMAPGDTLARILGYARLPYLPEDAHEAHALRYQLVTDETSFFVVHEREDKASPMPVLQKIAHMHAAGVHGVGTAKMQRVAFECVDMPMVARSVQAPERLADRMELPAFLRRERVAEMADAAPYGFERDVILSALQQVSMREELVDAVGRLAAARHGRGVERVIAALRRILGDKELAWYVLLEWVVRDEVVSPEVVGWIGEAAGGRGDEPEVRAVLASL